MIVRVGWVCRGGRDCESGGGYVRGVCLGLNVGWA